MNNIDNFKVYPASVSAFIIPPDATLIEGASSGGFIEK